MDLSWGQFLLFIAAFTCGWSISFPGMVCCVTTDNKVESEERKKKVML